jgi:hypothetical protein
VVWEALGVRFGQEEAQVGIPETVDAVEKYTEPHRNLAQEAAVAAAEVLYIIYGTCHRLNRIRKFDKELVAAEQVF